MRLTVGIPSEEWLRKIKGALEGGEAGRIQQRQLRLR